LAFLAPGAVGDLKFGGSDPTIPPFHCEWSTRVVMPIYEYECGACGDRHEFIQKFSDSPKRKCPSCGAQRLKRLVSAAAFHLKGSGWYVTDFRDKGKKKPEGKDGKDGKDKAGSEKSADKSGSDKGTDKAAKSSDSGGKSTTGASKAAE